MMGKRAEFTGRHVGAFSWLRSGILSGSYQIHGGGGRAESS
jgi:hypothetical protein